MSVAVLFRNEMLKARKRRAFWVTLGIFTLIVTISTVEAVRGARGNPDRSFALPGDWPGILGDPMQFGAFFFAVLMILLFASEFQWRTARQNVIDGLSKEQFYGGKIIVLGVLVAIFLAIPVLIGGTGALVASGAGQGLVRPADLYYMAGYIVVFLLWGGFAFLLAALVRAAGSAMGILFVYIPVEQLLGGLLGQVEALRAFVGFLPFQLLQSLSDGRQYYPEQLAQSNAARIADGREALVLVDTPILLAVALAYVLLFLAIALVSMRRRDL